MDEAMEFGAIMQAWIRKLVHAEVRIAMREVGGGESSTSQGGRWLTPPKAAKEVGIPVRAIRQMLKDGRIGSRPRNVRAAPKQVKHLVNVDEIIAAARDLHVSGRREAQPESLAEQAARIRAGSTGR